MKLFGQEIGAEGNEKTDQDLRAGLFAKVTRHPVLDDGRAPGDGDADGEAAQSQPQKCSDRRHGREGAVRAPATANRMQTRPDASLSSDSPSRMCSSRLGIGTRLAMADTAIGSVGETTAASAKATANGIAGISQWMKNPTPRTVNTTRPSASSRIVPLSRKSPFFGNAPAVQKQKRQEQEEENIRVQLDARMGKDGNDGAETDLDQGQRHRHRRHARQGAADHHRQQQEEDKGDRFHGQILRHNRNTTSSAGGNCEDDWHLRRNRLDEPSGLKQRFAGAEQV